MRFSLSCFNYVLIVTFLSVLAVTWALAEIRQQKYDLEKSCTTDRPQTVLMRKSKLHCASACSGHVECREWNFDETTKDCSLYKHKALFFAALPGCVRYKVMTVWVHFPSGLFAAPYHSFLCRTLSAFRTMINTSV